MLRAFTKNSEIEEEEKNSYMSVRKKLEVYCTIGSIIIGLLFPNYAEIFEQYT